MSEHQEPDFDLDRLVAEILTALAEDRSAEALKSIDALAQIMGGAPIVFHLAGLMSLRLNEPGKAVEAFLAAHRAEPELRDYSAALAIVLSKVGRLVDSLYYQKLSIAATRDAGVPGLVPDWLGSFDAAFRAIPEAPLARAAEAAFAEGDYDAAAGFWKKECEVDPPSMIAWRGLALAYLAGLRPFKAVAAAQSLAALETENADSLALLGTCLAQTARFDEAMAVHHRAEGLQPENAALAWATIVSAAHRPGVLLADLAELMTGWGNRFGTAPAPDKAPRSAVGQRRIRLGLVSAHWSEGDGLDTLIPVIELLDRRRIELFCYADGRLDAPLAIRARQRANSWCDLTQIDDATAALMIGNDDLDVLIDLDGPTRCTRPALFAARPAGLAFSAYGIAEAAASLGFDGVIGPAGAWTVDRLGAVIDVPGGLAALPSNLMPVERDPPGAGPIVFGTLAQRWQIGADTAACWAGILTALPDATLVLNLERLGGLEATHDFAVRFGTILPQDRVLSIGRGDTLTDYLRQIDVLLDPIDNPHPDEALAALILGVPVLTCRSATPRAATLAAWLYAAGLEELVAADRESYIAAAIGLAEPALRQDLADRIAAAIATELPAGAARQAARLGAAIEAAIAERAG